jgi:nucleoside-diphosphate-sugar epimerase
MDPDQNLSPQHIELQRCINSSKFLSENLSAETFNSKWIILGGTGYIGRWLTLFCQVISSRTKSPSMVTVATRNIKAAETKLRNFLPNQYPIPSLIDISDLQDPWKFSKIMEDVDTIIHASTPTDGNNQEIFKVPEITSRILENCKKIQPPRFIHLSSGGVYKREVFVGKLVPEGSDRVEKEAAINAYQRVKIEMEELVEKATIAGIVKGVNPRLFAFGGPGFPIESKYAFAHFMRSALRGENIVIQGNPSSTRSYLHPVDMVEWIFLVWKNIDQLMQGSLHIGSPIPVTMLTLATEIAQEFSGVKVISSNISNQEVEWYVPETLALRNLGATIHNSTLKEIISSWRNYLAPRRSIWY